MKVGISLVQNTIIIMLGKVFTQLLSFLLLPLYTKYLSPQDYGTVDVIFTVGALFVPCIMLQLDLGLFRFLVDSRDDYAESKTISRTLFLFVLLLCITFNCIYLLLDHFLDFDYSFQILVYIDSTIFLNMFLQYFRGLGKNALYSLICCVNGIVTVFCNIFLIIFCKLRVDGLIYSYVIGACVSIVVSFLIMLKRENGIEYSINKNIVVRVVNYSFPLIFNSVAWWMMSLSDRVIIANFLDYTYNGIYAVSSKFSTVLFSAYSIFNMAWTEVVSLNIGKTTFKNEIIQINEKITRALIYICAIITSLMYIIYPRFVGNEFKDGYAYIPILLMAVFFNCLAAQLGGILVALKKSSIIARTSFLGAIVSVLFNLVLINYIQLYAVSFAAISGFASMFYYRYLALRESNINYCSYDICNIFKSFFAFALSFAVYYSNESWHHYVCNIVVLFLIILDYKDTIIKQCHNVSRYITK